jgi:hypothetical protein
MHLKKPKKKGGAGKKQVKGGLSIQDPDDHDDELGEDGGDARASLRSCIHAECTLSLDYRLDLRWRHGPFRNPSARTRTTRTTQT